MFAGMKKKRTKKVANVDEIELPGASELEVKPIEEAPQEATLTPAVEGAVRPMEDGADLTLHADADLDDFSSLKVR